MHLEWDSFFFGFKVANIIETGHSHDSLKKVLVDLKKQNYRLVYWFTPPEISHHIALENKGVFADRKGLYVLDLSIMEMPAEDNEITIYDGEENQPDLLNLAIQCGEYSRFKTDGNFPTRTCQKMYTAWINNSINGSNADVLFVHKNNNRFNAMADLKIYKDYGQIGIIAVDAAERGNSLGVRLTSKIARYLKHKNIQRIILWTQLDNKSSCGFYDKVGYKLEMEQWGYHFWL